MKMPVIFWTVLCFLTTGAIKSSDAQISAQHNSKVSFGSLLSNKVTVNDFNRQAGLKVEKGYSIDTAVAYFGGANFAHVRIVNFYPYYDSAAFERCRRNLMPGSTVMFDVKITQVKTGRRSKESLSYIFYGNDISNNSPREPTAQEMEWKWLMKLKYKSGIIYFSGAGFRNVLKITVQESNVQALKNAYNMVVPGSIISFENVAYENEDGSKGVLNRYVRYE